MAMERVMRGADASLVVMHILTSKKMPKRVYIDDVIDRVALFLRFQVCMAASEAVTAASEAVMASRRPQRSNLSLDKN